MSENEFNENQRIRGIIRRQKEGFKIPGRQRPEGVGYHLYKNRWRVSAKLTEANWHTFRNWIKENDYSTNSGINYLIHTHPDLKNNG